MATARPGWSRRAQYGLFFSFLAVIAGILIGLILLALSLVAPKSFAGVRGAALDVTAPVAGALHEVTATASGVFTGAGNYWDAAQPECRAQARAPGDASADGRGARDLPGEPAAQGDAAAARARAGQRSPSAESSAPRSTARAASPSSPPGRSDGVQIGMPVRSPDGLVGRIVDTGALASRVLLVSDRANIVPARLLRGGIPVIAQGRGDGTIDVRPLEVGRNPFKRGDIIITSGTGGLYPPLVPIARVVKLDDDGAVALPLADPADDQFRDRRTAVRAGRGRRRGRSVDGRALMVRAALDRQTPDRPRARPLRAVRPGGDGGRRRAAVGACRSSRPAAGTPISASWCFISWRLLRPIRGRPGGPLRSVSSTTCSPAIR